MKDTLPKFVIALFFVSVLIGGYSLLSNNLQKVIAQRQYEINTLEEMKIRIIEGGYVDSPSIVFSLETFEDFLIKVEEVNAKKVYLVETTVNWYLYVFSDDFQQAWYYQHGSVLSSEVK